MSRDHNLLAEVAELQATLKAQEDARAKVLDAMQKKVDELTQQSLAIKQFTGASYVQLRASYDIAVSCWDQARALVAGIPCRPIH